VGADGRIADEQICLQLGEILATLAAAAAATPGD
jgi:hypothetical protein